MTVPELVADLKYYSDKCKQHLARAKLCHELALWQLVNEPQHFASPGVPPQFDKLAASCVAGNGDLAAKLIRAVRETHFLALKANFEFYLHRIATCHWHHRFDELAAHNH